MGITAKNGDLISLTIIDPNTIPERINRLENLVYGLVNIIIKTNNPGDTVTITLYFPKPMPAEADWRT